MSFSWQECSRRWAGAPRTHSTPEISQGPKFRKKQARRRQGGKDQDTDTRAHTPTHTPTCTNSRGIAAGGLADFATEISLRRAFYRFSSRGLPSSLPPPPPPPPPPVRPQFRTSRHTLFHISGPSPEFLSATGTRTRVARVRAVYPNQLDSSGVCFCMQLFEFPLSFVLSSSSVRLLPPGLEWPPLFFEGCLVVPPPQARPRHNCFCRRVWVLGGLALRVLLLGPCVSGGICLRVLGFLLPCSLRDSVLRGLAPRDLALLGP